MKKSCELCNSPAKLFCESDRASLCWQCDAKVHTANFLVTKHSRFLLCHVCQSPTAWHGTGPKFVPTITVCNHCVTKQNDHDDGEGTEEDDTENDGDTDVEEEEDDDDEENQVVPPWSSTPPPPVSSSSNSGASSRRSYHGEEGGSDK